MDEYDIIAFSGLIPLIMVFGIIAKAIEDFYKRIKCERKGYVYFPRYGLCLPLKDYYDDEGQDDHPEQTERQANNNC